MLKIIKKKIINISGTISVDYLRPGKFSVHYSILSIIK